MSATNKDNESQKTMEDFQKEIKNLKSKIEQLKEEIDILNIDKQMKNLKINFLEQKTKIQDEKMLELKNEFNKRLNQIEEKLKKGTIITEAAPVKEGEAKKEEEIKTENSSNDEVNKMEQIMKGQLNMLGAQLGELEKIKLIKYGVNKIEEKKKEEESKAEDDGKMKLVFKKDLAKNAPTYSNGTQMFAAFKTLKGDVLLAWVTKSKTIELYDLEKDTPVKTVKDAHTNDIYSCRHFVDTKTNSDLLITSSFDKSIKVWNVENMDNPVVKIDEAHSNGYIFTPCILSHEKLKENYIISCADDECIKVFDFNGKFLDKKIRFDGYINLLTTYYDKKEDKFFIIDANSRNVEVFNFDDLTTYKYYKLKIDCTHSYIVIYENKANDQVQLIDSNMKGFIHIWDFHTAECLKSISINQYVNGICLWDDQYLISTGKDKEVKVIDLKEGKVTRRLTGHNRETLSAHKVTLSKYGDCLISHGKDGFLKLWSF